MARAAQTVIKSIGANVRRLRIEARITQQALASAADIDVRYVQRIERARVNPSISVLVHIANALNVNVETLLAPARLQRSRPGRPRSP